jgi:hypothetical protein
MTDPPPGSPSNRGTGWANAAWSRAMLVVEAMRVAPDRAVALMASQVCSPTPQVPE